MPGWAVTCKLAQALGQPPTAFAAEVRSLEVCLFAGLLEQPVMSGWYIDPQWSQWGSGYESLAYMSLGYGQPHQPERKVVFPGLSAGTFLIFTVEGWYCRERTQSSLLLRASSDAIFEHRSLKYQASFRGRGAEDLAASESGLGPLYEVLREQGFRGEIPE
jgi:hypothetical protein